MADAPSTISTMDDAPPTLPRIPASSVSPASPFSVVKTLSGILRKMGPARQPPASSREPISKNTADEKPAAAGSRLAVVLRRGPWHRPVKRAGDVEHGGGGDSATSSFSLSTMPGPRTARRPRSILDLPPELQLLVVRHLLFADVERLRRTCHFYRNLVTPDLVWSIFAPHMRPTLLSHCHICLLFDPARTRLLCPDRMDPRYPLASRCVDCAAKAGEFDVGCKYALGNFASAWVCRWCGYPVPIDETPPDKEEYEFHDRCYSRFNLVLMSFFILGCLQACFNIVGCALVWRNYGTSDGVILGFSVSEFLASVFCFILCLFRGRNWRTYHYSLVLESFCLAAWVAIAFFAHRRQSSTSPLAIHIGRPSYVATLVFAGLNMLFRLFNSIGMFILMLNPKLWRRTRPGLSALTRAGYAIAMFFVAEAYPEAIQQEYPGKLPFGCC